MFKFRFDLSKQLLASYERKKKKCYMIYSFDSNIEILESNIENLLSLIKAMITNYLFEVALLLA